MVRVKIVKKNPIYVVGAVLMCTKNEAYDLIDSGVAVVTKDITEMDIKTKVVKRG